MSPIRLRKQRARSEDDKELRRRSLVESARRQLHRGDWSSLRVQDVARGAGVAKPSVFRYFRTKEELVLDVFLLELDELFAPLLLDLGAGQKLSPREAAGVIAHALAERPLFVQLAAAMQAVMSRNISVEAAGRFKQALARRLDAAGAALEHCLPALPRRSGARLLLRFHAVVIGVWQLANHPPNVARAIDELGLSTLRIDFAKEIEEMFVLLITGMEEQRS